MFASVLTLYVIVQLARNSSGVLVGSLVLLCTDLSSRTLSGSGLFTMSSLLRQIPRVAMSVRNARAFAEVADTTKFALTFTAPHQVCAVLLARLSFWQLRLQSNLQHVDHNDTILCIDTLLLLNALFYVLH